MNVELEKCIKKLQSHSGRPNKFKVLKEKMNGRFIYYISIEIAKFEKLRIGFDNHRNHQRPHLHIETGKSCCGTFSVAIDNGSVLHRNNVPPKILDQIKKWLKGKEECLRFIYDNIQNCKTKEDFEPLINAINKFL